jgi:hypothetical protein
MFKSIRSSTVLAILLGLATLAPVKALAGYCTCFGSGNIYDLLYYDSDGRRNLIYTYFSYNDCAEAKARTYLCNSYSADATDTNATEATSAPFDINNLTGATATFDYCNNAATRCWTYCGSAPFSCYQNCMLNYGCRP